MRCWIWTKPQDKEGYGYLKWQGRTRRSHRIIYDFLRGGLNDDLVIDHLCRNRLCQNPWHMEQVTNKENVLRGEGLAAVNARKTHCKNGHEFSPDNLYLTPRGRRDCRICRRAAYKRWWLKTKNGE